LLLLSGVGNASNNPHKENPAMTAATATRKPRSKPERRVHLYNAEGNPKLLEMTVGKDSFAYWLRIIDADYGIGFELRKCPDGINPLSADTYHVHYDPARRLSTCDCLGGLHHGHCKHQESILALIQSGKIAVPAAKPQLAREPVVLEDL
jgi:hypothetical protein